MGDISRHFSRHEFACKCGCGFDAVDVELLQALEESVEYFEQEEGVERLTVVINSGCRCESHNRDAGGERGSMHLKAIAADYWIKGIHEDRVADYLEGKYTDKYGIGRYHGRTHIDIRKQRARWDMRGGK